MFVWGNYWSERIELSMIWRIILMEKGSFYSGSYKYSSKQYVICWVALKSIFLLCFETVVCIYIYLLIIYLWNVPPFSPALTTTKQLSHHAIHSSFHQYWYNCINIILNVLISADIDLPNKVITRVSHRKSSLGMKN